ncbi:cobalt-precorrin-5B (C(1))-methyltransferase [Peribacillus saganii]|uniref:Cobalt-precorrin-5B C(1)-methyltransferase n=1 Tax=Peribacillus saganii TaxID=2303992 RepID=A0A372LE68_9BACI|nr:cobalt-precorrin-5B (C(1))-methyltransferase [Peribacillus saganii]RFU64519.1 cobalt-precorrin-5B (C(1))-methyltransferase [Peribacillus saganii]
MEETKQKIMREGFTTGACATAATKAALTLLITGEEQTEATIYLPAKRYATFAIEHCNMENGFVTSGVIKDAGDDPDVTHGAMILSTVSWTEGTDIILDGGKGVGRVTKPGLPVPVGEAAINPVPRKMLLSIVTEVLDSFQINRGVKVVISVPNGEEMAKKTLNGRLGILGGISILGTRGIVVPFSSAAYKASIIQAINVAIASGCDHVAITTGGRSEKFAIEQLPGLPEEAFIEMGDFVGFTLKQCKRLGIKKISMVGMMGKFSKVAQGVMMVHSKSAPIDFNFLARIAEETGVTGELIDEIKGANTASQVGDIMWEHGFKEYFVKLCEYCCRHAVKEAGGDVQIDTSLYTLKGEKLGSASLYEQ